MQTESGLQTSIFKSRFPGLRISNAMIGLFSGWNVSSHSESLFFESSEQILKSSSKNDFPAGRMFEGFQ
ncbi:hypothetical protein CH380_05765 [Leptospira adleri]|uniref:Uncharacterized protein n=1 Tax=Leptospira adleri TaxID=2023186 RepID=A0A2M9YR75_9LEPT|nr:hypothetical protein CH380_05765 [Leptospira adleri]PJZ63350.1 hypothetical protein CH376_03685 [Leptospira adleri]